MAPSQISRFITELVDLERNATRLSRAILRPFALHLSMKIEVGGRGKLLSETAFPGRRRGRSREVASVGRRWWKEGDGARPIRGTRGQRVENPRWTERWRGVLRHVPQRTVQGPPCVPLALAGYGYELRSCTSTARRPYGIPTRT
eukprot:1557587-Prymnesium_polylepis.1